MKYAFKLPALLAFLLLPCACIWGSASPARAEGWLSEFVISLKHDANAGDVEAQLTLGVMFYEGQGVSQDYAEARQWLEMAAGQNNAQAQFCLGEIYDEGKGVGKDGGKAVTYYQNAAFNGSAEAMLRLGDIFAEGRGVGQDKARASEWYGRSCRAGHRIGCGRYRKLTEASF